MPRTVREADDLRHHAEPQALVQPLSRPAVLRQEVHQLVASRKTLLHDARHQRPCHAVPSKFGHRHHAVDIADAGQ